MYDVNGSDANGFVFPSSTLRDQGDVGVFLLSNYHLKMMDVIMTQLLDSWTIAWT